MMSPIQISSEADPGEPLQNRMSCDVFDRIDSSNKGFVTRAELSDYVMQYNLTEADAQKVVDSLIPLHSCSISKADFMRIFEETTLSQSRQQGAPGAVGGCGSSGDHSRWRRRFRDHKGERTATATTTNNNNNNNNNINTSQDNDNDVETFSNSSGENICDEMDDEFGSYLKHSSVSDADLTEEHQNLFKIWSALKAHGDVTLEQIFKNFLGRLFVEMANQQSVIYQQSHRLQRLNESEAEKIDDLHKHVESELKQVIEQYESQIQDSIETYEKKIYLIRGEKDQLMDQLQQKNATEDLQSKQIELLNGRVDKYEDQLEQLRNELQRLQVHQKSNERMLDRHVIDQFTTPRLFRRKSSAGGRRPGGANRNVSYTETATDLDSGVKSDDETTTEVILNSTEYQDVYATTPRKTSSRLEMRLGDVISPNAPGGSKVTPIANGNAAKPKESNETLYYTIHHTTVTNDETVSEDYVREVSSGSPEDRDEQLEQLNLPNSTSKGVQTIARKQVDSNKPKTLLRNEGTSPDLEDDISLTSSYNTETDQSEEDDVTSTPNIDEVIAQDYDDVCWEEFPNLVEYTFKVILCGDAAVGKTSFLNQLCLGEFRESTIATIGMSFFRQKFRVRRSGKWTGVELQCWDTAGQEKFRSLPQSYFRNSDAAILMFDLTKRHTFQNLYDWIDRIEQVADFPRLLVVGNKCDLNSREVSYQEASKIAHTVDARYFEGSAKTGEGVSFVFKQLTEILVDDFERKTKGEVLSANHDGRGSLVSSKLTLTSTQNRRKAKDFTCFGTSCPN